MCNFFEQQAAAQRRTSLLVVCMLLSVLVMAAGVFASLYLVRGFLLLRYPPSLPTPAALSLARLGLWSSAITLSFVAGCALVRIVSLRHGGSSIADMLNARLVSGQPADGLDRRLLNVVTEMALAAGTPVPAVYVLDQELGINALAAGWQLEDAVICVTRGCLEKLTRAELQGVVAHEFSHILYGDARLNLRLMGVVYGMVSMHMLGNHLMQGFQPTRGREHGRSLAAIGVIIAVVGALGAFLGKLIKAAVSRQRELLADASAVQFTRNPLGIAGALKKIGGYALGARVRHVQAAEASHFFFDDIGQDDSWAWLSTHPDLRERIRRVDPTFDGQLVTPMEGLAESADTEPLMAAFVAGSARAAGVQAPEVPQLQAAEVLPLIGTTDVRRTSQPPAGERALHPQLMAASQSAFSACGLVFAMLIAPHVKEQRRQASAILELAGAALLCEAQRLHPLLRGTARAERLTLVSLTAPALRSLSRAQRQTMRRTVATLIELDGATDLFEHLLGYVLSQHWSPDSAQKTRVGRAGLSSLLPEIQLVLSALSHLGATSADAAEQAFAHALQRLPGIALRLLPQSPHMLAGLPIALERLRALRPTARSALIEASAHAVLADQRVTDDELSVLRAMCLTLEAPLPPLGDADRAASSRSAA